MFYKDVPGNLDPTSDSVVNAKLDNVNNNHWTKCYIPC